MTRKHRLLDVGRLRDQHAPRFPVFELELLDVVRFLSLDGERGDERHRDDQEGSSVHGKSFMRGRRSGRIDRACKHRSGFRTTARAAP